MSAGGDPASFAVQLAEARAAIRELCDIIDKYSCGCGDMAPPLVAYECENCKAAKSGVRE